MKANARTGIPQAIVMLGFTNPTESRRIGKNAAGTRLLIRVPLVRSQRGPPIKSIVYGDLVLSGTSACQHFVPRLDTSQTPALSPVRRVGQRTRCRRTSHGARTRRSQPTRPVGSGSGLSDLGS